MYKMIRSPKQKSRCVNGGSALYCKCGCQNSNIGDEPMNLDGVYVKKQSARGYADYDLYIGNTKVGSINTQYNALFLNGVEYLGVNEEIICHLLDQAMNLSKNQKEENAGSTIEETATFENIMEKASVYSNDEKNKKHPGYCAKCHSYCYGDCDA
jgi:hypothetical protein